MVTMFGDDDGDPDYRRLSVRTSQLLRAGWVLRDAESQEICACRLPQRYFPQLCHSSGREAKRRILRQVYCDRTFFRQI